MKTKHVSLLVVLVVMILSTGITANEHPNDKGEETVHHQRHHHHHHLRHNNYEHHNRNNIIMDDDGEDVTSQDDSDMPSDDEEEFYGDFSSRHELFQLTDKNGDGFVTREEYVTQNGNHTRVVDQVFKAYDVDGDGRFSEEEFLQQSSPLAVRDECEEGIIQTCDKLYLEFMTTELKSSKADETACKATQYLVDCVAGYDADCDIMSYARIVAARAQAYLDSEACPLLDLHLLLKLTGQGALSDGRKTRFARSVDDVESTTISDQQLYSKLCSESFINRCSKRFHKSLNRDRAERRYCPILASYERCLNKRVKHCLGNVGYTVLRQNIASLKNLQREAKSCHKTHRSWAIQ
ncbi:uncharacterized protein LOC119739379 [Patiria miniata]|uniref:EF-hand domain-containing protein n=1 Tax=Patiria miniata TaxID=46514 RepID=A0A914B2U3_PATMI|nr:uncharacterized protein LOC119739379 [Patiria miniata]XP_038070234.1 uncharacterized protein LOC119739379 [Patiria miniata]